MINHFGIIGNPVSGSFSPEYFNTKFRKLGINARYDAFKLDKINEFSKLVTHQVNLIGLNVTHPFKEDIIQYLDEVDHIAAEVGAVNTIYFSGGKSKGFNTDVIGINKSIESLKVKNLKAIILGSGGASKAVQYTLSGLNMEYIVVSRSAKDGDIHYDDLTSNHFQEFPLVINCTPLGMGSDATMPPIPYTKLNEDCVLFDLIYHPRVTPFLHKGLNRGCRVKNGLEMLIAQAEASWNIWNGTT